MRRPASAPSSNRPSLRRRGTPAFPMAAVLLIALTALPFAATAVPTSARRASAPALLDFEWPSGIDVAADGRAWLAMYTDFFSGGARQLDLDLVALGGFATKTHTHGIAVDAAGDLLLLQAGGDPLSADRATETIERYSTSGRHEGRIGMHADILDFDAAGGAGSAWALVGEEATSSGAATIPEAYRFDAGATGVGGVPTFEGASRIAGAPDGTFYVATDARASTHLVARFAADGTSLGSWSIENPILAIDVDANGGAVWVASMPPPMPDLSKTRIQGFPAHGGTPPGTAFADFEMDLDAVDIAAWSVRAGADVQCSVHGIGTFGIGALWTIARHDCDGALLATTRDIPWVGIWTPVPTATAGGSETGVPSETPSPTPSPTETGAPSTPDPGASDTPTPHANTPTPTSTSGPATPAATDTVPAPTEPPEPTVPGSTPGIYLPLVFDFALRADLSASTAVPTSPPTAASPTVTSPPTHTPTPEANAEVRVLLAHGAGFSLEQLIGGLPSDAPWFILYEDRTVLRRTSTYAWQATTADDADLAALADGLLVRSGFFGLPATNHECGIADIGMTFVHADDEDRAHTVRGEGLEMYASDGCVSFPEGTTLDQWRALAEGIETARSHDFGPAIGWAPTAGTIAVARSSMDGPRPWTVADVSLAAIAPAEEWGYATQALTGTRLAAVYAELGLRSSPVQFFEEAGETYAVGLRVEPPGWDVYREAP